MRCERKRAIMRAQESDQLEDAVQRLGEWQGERGAIPSS